MKFYIFSKVTNERFKEYSCYFSHLPNLWLREFNISMTYVVKRNAVTLSERLNLHDYNIFKLCSYNHHNYENIPFTVSSQSSVNTELIWYSRGYVVSASLSL